MGQRMKQAVVLVVEDEPLLRMAALDMVEEAGFTAITASDADEAVRILKSRPDITIVFTDIDMPGAMDGLQLAACIRDRWPPIKIIVVSGFKTPDISEVPAEAVFFSKPYSDRAIADAMRRMATN